MIAPNEGFNPRPRRDAGATAAGISYRGLTMEFQSPPAPRRGCNLDGVEQPRTLVTWFQSPPAPRRGCNSGAGCHRP